MKIGADYLSRPRKRARLCGALVRCARWEVQQIGVAVGFLLFGVAFATLGRVLFALHER